jgi:hypothetical protein
MQFGLIILLDYFDLLLLKYDLFLQMHGLSYP